MYYNGKVIQGMQKENLQKRRLARKEWLQFTVQIKSNLKSTSSIDYNAIIGTHLFSVDTAAKNACIKL